MFIRLDVFAEMLKTTPGELLHAARSTGELEGLTLPSRTHIRGALMMFDYEEAVKFAACWHARDLPPARPDGDRFADDMPLVPLTALAEQVGIAPLVLYEVVVTGKNWEASGLRCLLFTNPGCFSLPMRAAISCIDTASAVADSSSHRSLIFPLRRVPGISAFLSDKS